MGLSGQRTPSNVVDWLETARQADITMFAGVVSCTVAYAAYLGVLHAPDCPDRLAESFRTANFALLLNAVYNIGRGIATTRAAKELPTHKDVINASARRPYAYMILTFTAAPWLFYATHTIAEKLS